MTKKEIIAYLEEQKHHYSTLSDDAGWNNDKRQKEYWGAYLALSKIIDEIHRREESLRGDSSGSRTGCRRVRQHS